MHSEWPLVVAEAWAHYGQGNVLMVDWHVHARTFYKKTSTTQVFVVARTILDLLETIRKRRGGEQSVEAFYKQVHGAGHSLGAQILGIVGTKIRRQFNQFNAEQVEAPSVLLGKIYALDPAGFWLYDLYSEIHPDDFEYLSIDSAHLVMVLHTSRNYFRIKLGLRYLLGHYDFYVYVANGLDEWCPKGTDENCEHTLAINLFKVSMEPTAKPMHRLVGFKCHDMATNDAKVVEQEQVIFGLDDPPQGNKNHGNAYYLPINNQSPYNYVPYKLDLNMKKCVVFNRDYPDQRRQRHVRDIVFITETYMMAQLILFKSEKKNVMLWSRKCKYAPPSPFPITIEWDDKKMIYINKERVSNEPIGGKHNLEKGKA